VLQQAAQLVKPGGKLLMLEHGRSSWEWLNAHMDERAAHHHATYGCWYNRDILGIVEQAGLRVHSCSRWHLGTSYLIVASPPAAAGGPAGATTGAATGGSCTAAAREQAACAA
jgi:methyltransferase OMS1